MTFGRWLAVVVLILAGIYAWRGGLFTSSGYRQLEREEIAAEARLIRIHREIDSMKAFRDSLATDPKVQERVARTQWGMIREGELSFLIQGK